MPATPLTIVPPGRGRPHEAPGPDDPLEAFARHLGGRDPKTVAAYLTVLRDLVHWLTQRPGGRPFRMELLTATAVRGYLEHLQTAGRAPRTRSKALSVLRRFGRWAVDEGLLRRNPAAGVERPTVVALAPTELTADQRYVLGVLLERADSRRLDAVVALAYWAGLRISEVATLSVSGVECTT